MSDAEVTPEWSQVISDVITHRLGQVWVSLPGRIEKYTASTQLADIKPLIKDNAISRFTGEAAASLPVIPNVPIKFPRGGGYFLSFPLAVGDTVELHFCSRSLDLWLSKGGEIDPVSFSQHDLSDATAELGLYAQPDKLTSADASKMVIGKDGDPSLQITIDGTSINVGGTATAFAGDATKISTELNKILTALNSAVAPTGGGPVTYGSPYVPGSVAATKVKVL